MSRKDDMEKYYGFYKGDIDVVYTDFKSRRVSSDAIDNDNVLPKEKFTFREHIRFLVDKLVNYLPTSFDFEVYPKGSDKVIEEGVDKIKAWLEGPYHGGGKTFWEVLPGIYKTGYIYGTEYTKLYTKNGTVNTKKMYSEDVTIIVNPDNVYEVQKIIFEWEKEIEDEEGSTSTVTMKEIITDTEYQTWQDDELIKPEKHNAKRIPVIILKHEEVDGSEYGDSLVGGLIEAQQNINFASTMRQRANQMNSFKLYCAENAEDGLKISGEITIEPGRFVKIPIKTVGGDVNLQSIENEIEDYVDEIHNLANVPRRKRIDAISGGVTATEINMIMRDMNEAAKRYISQCKKAFEEMLELYYFMQYGSEVDVKINYQDMSVEDNEWKKWMADWLARNGYFDEAMRVVGYEDEDIKKLKDDQAKSDALVEADIEAMRQKNNKPEDNEPKEEGEIKQ